MLNSMDQSAEKSTLHRLLFYLGALCIATILMISHRPDALFRPQFYAEDGVVFFADAYNIGGIKAFLMPYSGYLLFVPRLVAFIAVPFGSNAPAILNLFALLFQLLPVIYILSLRLAYLVPDSRVRVYIAFLYVGFPSISEIHLNITNTQWHLALLACLILLSNESKSRFWQIFEFSILTFSGLSGPFCLLLVPIAFLRWFFRRNPILFLRLGLLLACACVQTSTLSHEIGHSRKIVLSFEPLLLAQILSLQILIGGITGHSPIALLLRLTDLSLLNPILLLLAVFLTFCELCFIIFCLWKGSSELKLLLLFGGLCFAASLVTSPWLMLCKPGVAMRYWYIPRFANIAALIWASSLADYSWIQRAARVLLSIHLLAVVLNWPHHAFEESHFDEQYKAFLQQPSGTIRAFPVQSASPMVLKKK
jgi:hypothetical protein